jgi:predicted permease
VLLFGFGVTVATALVFGLVPAFQASRPDLVTTLKDEIGTVPGGRGRLQAGLVVAQVALSLVTLVSAGLFIRSLALSRQVDTGFRQPEGVLLVDTDTYIAGFRDTLGVPVARRLLEAVRAVPGVEAASIGSDVPLGFGGNSSMSITVPGYAPQPNENMSIQYYNVAGDYFRTMQADIVQGRAIADEDRRGGQRVAVVNETFVRRFFAGREPIGATFDHGAGPVTIVGVARDWKYRRLNEPPRPFVFYVFEQRFWKDFTVYVRASGDPKALTAALRRTFHDVAADLPLLDVRTLAEHTAASAFAQQLGAYMLSGFGFLALLLSAIGIYGVMAYSVSRRTREIGVRVALGATGRAVVRLVVGRAMRLAGVGLVIGGAAAIAAGQLLRSLLIGVSPYDPVTLAAIPVLLGAVALLASWVPARRAARIDPMVALRYE